MDELYIDEVSSSWFDTPIEERMTSYVERLECRRKELETEDSDAADMEMYCIDEVMTDIYDGRKPETPERYEGILNWYDLTAEIAEELGVDHVYDIGCAYGHQSVIYEAAGIRYTGIDMYDFENPFPDNGADYIIRKYPFSIPREDDDLRMAVSHLCLGWFSSREPEIQEMEFQQIAEDFDYYMCQVPYRINKENLYDKYFDTLKVWQSKDKDSLSITLLLKPRSSE